MKFKSMKKIVLFFSCCLLGLGSANLFAQQGFVATGGNASGTGGSASYSIGQVEYTSASGTTHNIIQGLQQPYEISVLTGIKETGINLTASVYPNPSTNNFTLTVESGKWKNLSYQLYDTHGKLLLSNTVETNETTIGIGHLAAAQYFFVVSDNNNEIKTFKIIKSY